MSIYIFFLKPDINDLALYFCEIVIGPLRCNFNLIMFFELVEILTGSPPRERFTQKFMSFCQYFLKVCSHVASLSVLSRMS